jgi:hypothetical protein
VSVTQDLLAELAKADEAVQEALAFVRSCMKGEQGAHTPFEAAQVYLALSSQRLSVMRAMGLVTS